jgi:hypothetical protein
MNKNTTIKHCEHGNISTHENIDANAIAKQIMMNINIV